MSTPHIESMYEPTKCFPAKIPKTQTATGKFIDWGTKLYQLELELSYKNNEIAILKKKLNTFAEELYPNGDTGKKSRVNALRRKCEIAEAGVLSKTRQLNCERKKSKKLEGELTKLKKLYLDLQHTKINNEKSVQTISENNKGIQVKPARSQIQTRTVMTQCTPVFQKSSSTVITDSASHIKILEREFQEPRNAYLRSDTSLEVNGNLCDASTNATDRSITSPGSDTKLSVTFDSDSGISSRSILDESIASPHQHIKPSYTEILSKTFPVPPERRITYEQSLHHYMNNSSGRVIRTTPVPLVTSSLQICRKAKEAQGQSTYTIRSTNRNSSRASGPSYLFKRESNGENTICRNEKPVFVYKSEIYF